MVLRVRNMLEIVLGVLVLIGFFVFWCDVTDSWNNVFRPGSIRSNIDDKIREAEQIVSETGPRDINERPEDRVAAFLRELRQTLRQRLEQEPQNKIWHEAVLLLDISRIRIKR